MRDDEAGREPLFLGFDLVQEPRVIQITNGELAVIWHITPGWGEQLDCNQTAFPICTCNENLRLYWPGFYRIAFLGQMADWREEWKVQSYQRFPQHEFWSRETWVVWLVSHCVMSSSDESGEPNVQASFLVRLRELPSMAAGEREPLILYPSPVIKPEVYDEERALGNRKPAQQS